MCVFLTFQLETVNKNLEAYYDAWDKFIKAWIVIKIKDPSCVYEWRLQVNYYCIVSLSLLHCFIPLLQLFFHIFYFHDYPCQIICRQS